MKTETFSGWRDEKRKHFVDAFESFLGERELSLSSKLSERKISLRIFLPGLSPIFLDENSIITR